MFWRLFRRSDLAPAELARRQHELWLSDAFQSGRPFRRIPIRRIDASSNGFDAMMAREEGRRRAERWWDLALEEQLKEDARRFRDD